MPFPQYIATLPTMSWGGGYSMSCLWSCLRGYPQSCLGGGLPPNPVSGPVHPWSRPRRVAPCFVWGYPPDKTGLGVTRLRTGYAVSMRSCGRTFLLDLEFRCVLNYYYYSIFIFVGPRDLGFSHWALKFLKGTSYLFTLHVPNLTILSIGLNHFIDYINFISEAP